MISSKLKALKTVLNNAKNQSKSSAIETLFQLCAAAITKKESSFQVKNWENVIDLAVQHRITKGINQVIKSQKIGIPSTSNDQLAAINKRGTLRMLAFSAEISSICHQLNKQSISVIPLKGPIAAKQIYGDFTAKFSRDIDFLIQAEQIDGAIQYIEQQGYVCTYSYQSLSAKQKISFQTCLLRHLPCIMIQDNLGGFSCSKRLL